MRKGPKKIAFNESTKKRSIKPFNRAKRNGESKLLLCCVVLHHRLEHKLRVDSVTIYTLTTVISPHTRYQVPCTVYYEWKSYSHQHKETLLLYLCQLRNLQLSLLKESDIYILLLEEERTPRQVSIQFNLSYFFFFLKALGKQSREREREKTDRDKELFLLLVYTYTVGLLLHAP